MSHRWRPTKPWMNTPRQNCDGNFIQCDASTAAFRVLLASPAFLHHTPECPGSKA